MELVGNDPVAGRLTDRTGHATNFVGWLGLAGAIEALTEPSPAEACLNTYLFAAAAIRPGSSGSVGA